MTSIKQRFLDSLPDALKGEREVGYSDETKAALAEVKAGLLEAFEAAQPQMAALVTVQFVDEGGQRTWEVVDRTKPKGKRIVAAGLATEEEAEEARQRYAKTRFVGGGAYVLEAVDTDEPFHDTDYEILGNMHLYGVISGCATTADAANMTVDLATGRALHNGAPVLVPVAANAYTLVADGSNERWAALCLSSTGTAVLVSGDAAANGSTEPTKPEIGDRVLVTMVKIQAAQTIAANAEYDLDKRVMTHAPGLAGLLHDLRDNRAKLAEFDAMQGASTDGLAVGFGLQASIESGAAINNVTFRGGAVDLVSGTTADTQVGFKSPSGALLAFGDRNPHFVAILTTSAGAAALKAGGFGFHDSQDASDFTGTTRHKAFFRQVTTGALFAVTGNGSSEETTSLSGSHTLGTAGVFEVLTVDDGVTWVFRIGGVTVATHTTQVPTATTGMYVVCLIENNTTTSVKFDDVDMIKAVQDRS